MPLVPILTIALIGVQPPDEPAAAAPETVTVEESASSEPAEPPSEDDDGVPTETSGAPTEEGAASPDAPTGTASGSIDAGSQAEAAPEGASTGAAETGSAGESADTDPNELDMGDIFGDPDELDLEEIPEDGQAGDAADQEGRRKLLQGDLKTRFRIVTSAYFDIDGYDDGKRWKRSYDGRGKLSRQENRLEFYFSYQPNEHIQIVGDVEPVFMGASEAETLNDLSSRRMLTPFHVESDAAYLAVLDALPNLDIKIGRQIVVWGTADKFSPTNNLNPDDLEDRPLFTEPIANQMVVVDFAPLRDRLWFQAAYVPMFYPALLPPSATAALQDPESLPPFANESDVQKVQEAQRFLNSNPCFATRVVGHVENPEANLQNGQVGAKVGSRLGQLDLSASYYYGRSDIPLPFEAGATRLADCTDDPTDDPEDGIYFLSDAYLRYPRMHVAGLDFASQIPFLGNLGIWGEGGVFFPTQEHRLQIEFPFPIDVTPDDDTPNAVREVEGATVLDRPFVKVTAGGDYTIGKHVYVNVQYVRGFINEFGAGNMGNYVVAGTDLIFGGRHLIFRIFGVAELPDERNEHMAGAIAPEIIVVPPWGYLTFELGAFALLGDKRTTLAQSGAGSSIAYLKLAGQF